MLELIAVFIAGAVMGGTFGALILAAMQLSDRRARHDRS
jgi:hypothetical protein